MIIRHLRLNNSENESIKKVRTACLQSGLTTQQAAYVIDDAECETLGRFNIHDVCKFILDIKKNKFKTDRKSIDGLNKAAKIKKLMVKYL